MTKFVN